MRFKLSILFFYVLVASSCEWTSDTDAPAPGTMSTGQGIVPYTGYAPLKDKPVNIHFYIPEGEMKTMPVVFIMPGTDRNAKDYLGAWIRNAGDKKVIAVALEFPESSYSTSEYIEGNMFKGKNPVAEENWSYSVIEPIFSYIKAETGSTASTYRIWGHSAGAQFVHRFVTFKSGLRINKAIAANGGWYTVPDTGIGYPYGLKDSGYADASTLTRLFGAKLIVMLGDQDTDPNDSSLRHTPEADAQGLFRYDRGLYYFSESQRICKAGSMAFGWKKTVVPGVAHDYNAMLKAAIKELAD